MQRYSKGQESVINNCFRFSQKKRSLKIIQAIFCPDNYHLERQKNSLKSLKNCKREVDSDIYLDGWVKDDDTWRSLTSYIDKIGLNILYMNRRSNNVGKSRIINSLAELGDYDNIFYMDSDILLDIDTIHRLRNVQLLLCKDVILVPNQREDSRHNLLIQKIKDSTNGEEILSSNLNIGIAGGVFLTKSIVLENHSFLDNGPYSSDDVHFFEETSRNDIKTYICKNIFVTHPFDTDKEYSKWKINKSLSLYHVSVDDNERDLLIEESEKFWKNKI